MDIKALKEEFNRLAKANQDLIDAVAAAKRTFSTDEDDTKDKNFSRMKEIQDVLEAHQKQAQFSLQNGTARLPTEPEGRDAAAAAETAALTAASLPGAHLYVGDTPRPKIDLVRFKRLAREWFHTGNPQLFATITTASASGLILPREVLPPIAPQALNVFREAIATHGAEDMALLKTPTTEAITLPIFTTNIGSVLSETAVASDIGATDQDNPPGLTESVDLSVKTYQSGQAWYSLAETLAVSFDILGATVPALQYSKELELESDSLSTISADSNISNTTATATVSGLTYANLNTLNNSLPKRYRPFRFMVLSHNAYVAAEQLVTTTGYPILTVDAQNQMLKRFNGTPVFYSDYLSAFGANNVVGIIGSLMGVRLRDVEVAQLERYTMIPQRPGQTGLNLIQWHKVGYSPSAMGKLVCPAS